MREAVDAPEIWIRPRKLLPSGSRSRSAGARSPAAPEFHLPAPSLFLRHGHATLFPLISNAQIPANAALFFVFAGIATKVQQQRTISCWRRSRTGGASPGVPGLSVLGIDVAETALAIAREKAADRGIAVDFPAAEPSSWSAWAAGLTPCWTADCSTPSTPTSDQDMRLV
jgi:hypothetical protein